MKDLYIGDFVNPEDEKEPWEEYLKRRSREEKAEEENKQRMIMVAVFALV